MKKHFNILLSGVAYCGAALFCLASCGGGGGGSSTPENEGGLAPKDLTMDMVLTPTDFDAGGRVVLTATPARVAYFNSERDEAGNYVDGSGGSFSQGMFTYTGNYTYTKCGPDMVDLKIDNLRAEPADTASDCHWTIVAKLTFIDKDTAVFTGTETLVDSGGNAADWRWVDANNNGKVDAGEIGYDLNGDGVFDPVGGGDGDTSHNDPMGFGGFNHFPGVMHAGGGTRNFSLNYKVSLQAH